MTDLAAWAILLLPALMTLVLATELFAAQWRPARLASGDAPRIAILIPAHDEQAGIGATIARIGEQAPGGSRLLVVADNCTDDTAAIVRAAGVELIERRDPDRVGKGYALAFGRDHLAANPPDVVLVIDADCTMPSDGIARIAATAHACGRPVQSAYLMQPRPDRGSLTALSGFAFLIRNLVRQRGLARLHAPALLTGSGMAFPWSLFATAPLASADIVEDLSLGITLARAGHPPAFLPTVQSWSEPADGDAVRAQRTRWEHGYLRTALHQAPRLLGERGRWPLFWLGLHLIVPPLALLGLTDMVALAALGGFAQWGGASALPALLLLALISVLLVLLLVSWARFGRAQISFTQLLLLPAYIIWKLPIYALALFQPQRIWVRTRRD